MNIYVKDLVELSKIDKELDSFNPQIEVINKKVNAAQKKVSQLEEKKLILSQSVEDNGFKIASFEEQIVELKAQLDEIKKKSGEVKTEKEIAALSTEEQIAKDKLTYANEEIERLNKANDISAQQLEELEAELDAAIKEAKDIEESVKEEYAKIEKSKAELYAKRDETVRAMDKKILAFYEKIRNWAGNSAVVKVQKQACMGCYMKINDKAYSDLIKGEEIVTCPHCGRVLYIEVEENREA